jgi:hypothetical protein
LIVNYQTYAELTSCLQSLVRFPTEDVEVVVVDHLADPAAAAAVRREFPSIHLIEVRSNPGFANGVNRAAHAAGGTYLLLLNPDCTVDEDVAHGLATWLDEHRDVGVCGARIHEADGSVQQSARSFPDASTGFAGRTAWLTRVWPTNRWSRRNLVAQSLPHEPMACDWVSGACMMVRRIAFEEVGGMDERFFLYWEDADLCHRLRQKGWLTFYNPNVQVTHFTGRSSQRAEIQSAIAFHKSAFTYFWTHATPARRLIAPLVYLALHVRLGIRLAQIQIRRARLGTH